MKKKVLLAFMVASFVASSAMSVSAEPFRYEEEWNDRTNSWNWGRSAIHWAYAEGVTSGKMVDGVNCFDPDNSITRAEAATMLVKIKDIDITEYNKDSEDFTDVNDAWYTPYINAAFANKIVSGKGDGIFDPNGSLTRAEAATMIVKAMEYKSAEKSGATFEDISDEWYTDYIKTAYDNGIVSGKSATLFDPNGQVTRAELVMMLYNSAMSGYEKGMYCAIMIPKDARGFSLVKGEDVLLSYDESTKSIEGATRIVEGEDWKMVYFAPTDSFEIIPQYPEVGVLTKMRIFSKGGELAVGARIVSKVVVSSDKSVTVYANTDRKNIINGLVTSMTVQENVTIEADNGDSSTSKEIWEKAVKLPTDLKGEGFESYQELNGTLFGKYPIRHPYSQYFKFSPADESISMEIDLDYDSTRLVHNDEN